MASAYSCLIPRAARSFAEDGILSVALSDWYPYVRDPDQNVGQLITDAVAKIGENIQMRRFVRYVLGEQA